MAVLAACAAWPGPGGRDTGLPSLDLTPNPSAAGTTEESCHQSVQPLIDAAPDGAVVTLPACVIRETLRIPRPMTILGVAGSEIRGSDIWADWQPVGATWRSSKALPAMPAHGVCVPGTSRCLQPEEVFRDGIALRQVDRDPGPDQFTLDAERRVVLGRDPAGSLLEVGIRASWVLVGSDGVTIERLIMRHATNDAQSGALSDNGHAIVVRDCALSDAHGANVWLTGRSELLDSDVANAGQLGIGVGGARVAGNHVHDNGTEGFDPGWEAGGFKAVTHAVVVEGNEFDHNAGSGIWFDIGSTQVLVRDNRVHDNSRVGILIEISSDVRVTANTVWNNGQEADDWLNGAGILVHSSARVEVDHNLVAWNGDGIGVESQERPDMPPDAPSDIHVHDNVIVMEEGPDTTLALGWVEDWAGSLFDPASDNVGEANRFWYPADEGASARFAWSGPIDRLAVFGRTPGGRDSSYLPDAEAHTLLHERGVPAAPDRAGGPDAWRDPGAETQRAELRAWRDPGADAQPAELLLVGVLLALMLVVSLVGVRVGVVPGRRLVVVAPLVALGYAIVVQAISRIDLVPDPLEGLALVTTVGVELVALGLVVVGVGRAVAERRRRGE